VARHWNVELVSVFLYKLMSFPIASMRLVFPSSVYKYKTLKINMQINREKYLLSAHFDRIHKNNGKL